MPYVSAHESASTNYRVTRDSINQGGLADKQDSAPTAYRMTGSVGEPGGFTMSYGGGYRVGAGVMKIYYYPGTVTTLSLAQGAGEGEIRMTWTSPGANGSTGTATSYIVKFSTYTSPGPMGTQAQFEAASTFGQSLSPKTPPGSESLTITGLQPGTSYYIAIEARDADKNQAYLSTSAFTWAQVSIMSVDISSDAYHFGQFTQSTAAVSTSTIRVTNNGTRISTWHWRASTITAGSPWQITTGAQSPSDSFRLSAALHATRPTAGQFGAEDRMSNSDQTSDGTKFTIDGSTTGASVAAGQYRNLWFLIETPLSTSTSDQQTIQVTVTANAP